MRPLLFLLCLFLVGCATPRQACLVSASRELADIDRLIARTEGNLSRGYALVREPYQTAGIELCGAPRLGPGIRGPGPRGRSDTKAGPRPGRSHRDDKRAGGPSRGPRPGLHYCATTETRYRDAPQAFDPVAERRKLAELRRARARVAPRTAEAQAVCRARHPEG